ncbi:PilX N-terminal domain-containing pilus assembly protein [Azonexus sp.]|jgi:type IV pilus assembly protein PilX|uniref:pilus assembly PilX family protein n=1 Tax=Azonexus sp. TaxID=1872668 RepID=UPI0028343D93|nr:PilX N-terminal domain-containing pilus assembly protein [Azonexus sp.]MDR1994451.1 hypothetical protein [Azonexus sp.]
MNTCNTRKDGGFALIMAMIILFVLTILVVNAVRNSSMSEQMAGSYMDRNRAMQAAEMALREGEAKLATLDAAFNPLCLDGCTVIAGAVAALAAPPTVCTPPAATPPLCVSSIPTTWANGGNESTITFNLTLDDGTTKQMTASYRIILLDNALRDPSKDASCKAYSIMGQGAGIDSRTEVILQTIAHVCPLS